MDPRDIECIKTNLNDALTVEEMIRELQQLDPQAKVVIHFNRGDHWWSEVADGVRSIDETKVEWSDYHDKLKIATSDNDNYCDFDGDDEDFKVIAIGASCAANF